MHPFQSYLGVTVQSNIISIISALILPALSLSTSGEVGLSSVYSTSSSELELDSSSSDYKKYIWVVSCSTSLKWKFRIITPETLNLVWYDTDIGWSSVIRLASNQGCQFNVNIFQCQYFNVNLFQYFYLRKRLGLSDKRELKCKKVCLRLRQFYYIAYVLWFSPVFDGSVSFKKES